MATNRIHLTLDRIRKMVPPAGKQAVYVFDDDPRHLSVRITPAGAKSFIYSGKLNGSPFRVTIGSVDVWNLDDARAEARRLQTITDQGRDPRQVQREITDADELARAAAAATKLAKEEEQRRKVLTLGDAWKVYCKARRPKWGDRSYRDHQKLMLPERSKGEKTLGAGVLASLASLPLAEITSATVADWLDAESDKRATQTALGFRLLRAFMNWAADYPEYSGIADPSACARKVSRDHLPKPKAKDDALQREQLRLWFDGVRNIQNRRVSVYLQGMLITGARPNELAGLRWADVDFQWGSLTIHDKVEGERTIPLTPYLGGLLRGLQALNQTQPSAFRILHGRNVENDVKGWKPSELVFCSGRSASGQIESAGSTHRAMLRNVGLPNVTLHGLRRSFGSLTEWIECPVGIVAQIQGHKPSATAEKHYRVRPIDLLRMWHTKIEAWILTEAGIEQSKQGKSDLQSVPSAA